MAERFFNTSGPVVPANHYCIPPLERFDLHEVLRLIRHKRYFVVRTRVRPERPQPCWRCATC